MIAAFSIAATLGAIAHGLQLSDSTLKLIWPCIFFSLGIVVACFVLGAIHELWGQRASQRLIPVMALIVITYTLISIFGDGGFIIFIIYEAIGMLLALSIYLYIYAQRQHPNALWMIIGILITIIAAVVQAMGKHQITIIWPFDHNGIFHLIQIVGMAFLFKALKGFFQDEPSLASNPN